MPQANNEVINPQQANAQRELLEMKWQVDFEAAAQRSAQAAIKKYIENPGVPFCRYEVGHYSAAELAHYEAEIIRTVEILQAAGWDAQWKRTYTDFGRFVWSVLGYSNSEQRKRWQILISAPKADQE